MTISIHNHGLPFQSHDLYDVTFDDEEIETLVTHCPSMVKAWINNTEISNRRRLHRLIIGLDAEWRPNFNGDSNPVAILQLCVGRSCLIFQLIYAPRIPRCLRDFLKNPNYTFVGVGIDGDVDRLWDDYDLEVSNTVDLRGLAARELGARHLRNAGLKPLAREVLGKEFEKPRNVTLSKWDKAWLTDAQVAYACVDAFLSYKIGRRLNASTY